MSNHTTHQSLHAALLAHCTPREANDCWLWTGATSRFGYGKLRFRGKTIAAHRLAYELQKGVIEDGLLVLHSCDNPRCCNPNHLFLGTQADNISDKIKKNRQPRGEQCHQAILTEADVLEIRRLHKEGVTQRAIALQFKTNYRNVHNIIRRNSWKHIP